MSNSLLLQCLLGISCNDFAMIAADQVNTNSIFIMKHDDEKLYTLSNKLVMGVNGEGGDTVQFAQYIAKNIHLYNIRNQYPLDVDAVVHFTRRNLADSLRSRSAYVVNLLFAGYDEKEGGQLYYMDFLASCFKIPYAAHGLGGLLSLSILQRYYKPTMSEKEAYELLKMCVMEVHQRLSFKLSNFQVSRVSKTGVHEMPVINAAMLEQAARQ